MLVESLDIIANTALGTAQWVWRNIVFEVPWSQNYFWGLTLISLLVWGAELSFPWRKNQAVFRHDFWLDASYMYFNFFVFSIVISGIYAVAEGLFANLGVGMQSISLLDISNQPLVLQLLIFLVILDFLQWITHWVLHRVPLFWRFHQVHHSIQEMGFAGHLRYHWMENILYKPLKTFGVMLLGGFEPQQAFIVHFFSIIIGHLNHANIKLDYGPLRYVFNNPVMHLYHHAYDLPEERGYGMNYGITLSLWDYLFKTAYVPEKGGQIKLGFAGDENMPKGFFKQLGYGFTKPNKL